MKANTVWLSCQATEGMFPQEAAVLLETLDGPVNFFAPKTILRGSFGHNGAYSEAKIRVYKLGEDSEGAVVVLPQPPIDGSTIVKVRKTQIANTP